MQKSPNPILKITIDNTTNGIKKSNIFTMVKKLIFSNNLRMYFFHWYSNINTWF